MLETPKADKLLLPFNRPAYYSVPEALVSALCWRAFYVEDDATGAGADNAKPVAYMYHVNTEKARKTVDVRTTRPAGDGADSFGSALVAQGLRTDANTRLLGEAVAASVLGVRIEQNGNQPASPMTPSLALLQDMSGVTGKAKPAEYGDILEAMYSIGCKELPTTSAAELCLNAMDQRLRRDALLASIDAALVTSVLPERLRRRNQVDVDEKAFEWRAYYPDTPFVWFAEVWQLLNKKEWVRALPARVWVDWASTVLRLAVGMGYLWEYSWYEAAATAVARRRVPDSFAELLESVKTPLPWQSSTSSVSVRDVGRQIKTRLARGDVAWRFLREELKQAKRAPGFDQLDAISFLRGLSERENTTLKQSLMQAKEPPQSLWETVRYGLQTREASGPHTDYFGILRPRGTRFLLVDPGTEWIAVIASLSCNLPGGKTNVRTIMQNLARMGLQPEVGDLISLLERAGLARGSADADQAVTVQSAF